MKIPKWVTGIVVAGIGFLVAFQVLFSYLAMNATSDLQAVRSEIINDGGILHIEELPDLFPDEIEYISSPTEESVVAFLLSPEAAGPLSGVNPKDDWPWYEAVQNASLLPHLPEEEITTGIAAVEDQQELIQKLQSLANQPLTRPEDIIALSQMDTTMMWTLNPNLLAMQSYASLLTWDAYIAWQNGDPNTTLASCETVMKLCRHLLETPLMMNNIIAMGIARSSMELFSEIAMDSQLSDAAIDSYIQTIDTQNDDRFLKSAMHYEVVAFSAMMADMNKMSWRDDCGSIAHRITHLPIFDFVGKHDESVGLSIFQEFVESLQTPFYEWDSEAFEKSLQSKRASNTPMSNLYVDGFADKRSMYVIHQHYLLEQKVALHINRYHRDTSEYPKTMQDLVPNYLDAVPLNPITGNPVILEYFDESESEARHDEEHARALSPHLHHFKVGTDQRLRID